MSRAKPKDPKDWYPNDLTKTRCKEYGIPMPSYWPMDNNVLVWRLPDVDVTPGGLVIPDTSKSPHIKGILLSMGPRAMDVLLSNGIDFGHTVVFTRFGGWEAHDHVDSTKLETMFLILKDRDIIGSDELRENIATGKSKFIKGADGRHALQIAGRKEKLLALAASTDSKHEAETARRLAANGQGA
jgi:chaperonin GroES